MHFIRKISLGLGLLFAVGGGHAAPITLTASQFSVTYDSSLGTLYGPGFLSGSLDTVYFQPTAFAALSGGTPASTQETLQLTFTAKPGYAFTGFTFTERGDYFIFGQAALDVAAIVTAVNPAVAGPAMFSLSPGSPLDQTMNSTPWALSGSVGGLAGAQTLLVTLDNTLFADAPSGSLGFIQKTYAGFRMDTVATPAAVPEPSSWSLLLIGMLGALLVGAGRRPARATRVRA